MWLLVWVWWGWGGVRCGSTCRDHAEASIAVWMRVVVGGSAVVAAAVVLVVPVRQSTPSQVFLQRRLIPSRQRACCYCRFPPSFPPLQIPRICLLHLHCPLGATWHYLLYLRLLRLRRLRVFLRDSTQRFQNTRLRLPFGATFVKVLQACSLRPTLRCFKLWLDELSRDQQVALLLQEYTSCVAIIVLQYNHVRFIYLCRVLLQAYTY